VDIVTKESNFCLEKIDFGLRHWKTILFDNIDEGMQVFEIMINGLRKY